MEVKEAIEKRRSIRKFKPDPVPDEIIGLLLEAARLAPSGTNLQPWRFVIVKSQEMKEKLGAAIPFGFIRQAPVVLVCCADTSVLDHTGRRVAELFEAGAFSGTELEGIDPSGFSYPSMEAQAARAYLSLNVAIAVEHIMLRATDLGIGSCWTMMFSPKRLKNILELEDSIQVVTVVPLGYPDQSPGQRPRLPRESLVIKTV